MSSKYIPKIKTQKEIAEEAKKRINEERSGKQLGLRTRFGKLNVAIGRFFRFSQVYSINGLSGHGKSAFLNILLQDFKNTELNGNYKTPFIIVHNCFEMLPVDEVLRTVSSKLEVSHLHLLSSEMKYNEDGLSGEYNVITDKEFEAISQVLDNVEEEVKHYYFEEPTNTIGLLKNIEVAVLAYKDEIISKTYNIDALTQEELKTYREKIPNPRIVMALDHTLLVEPDKGDGVLDTISRIAKASIYLKKQGCLVLLVGQLNNVIESEVRIRNPDLHYPIKSDIYAQAQIYNACDGVLIIHQPELLGILKYGKNQYNTANLVHLQLVKQRFGKVGSIWLKNEFSKGRLIQIEPQVYKEQYKVNK